MRYFNNDKLNSLFTEFVNHWNLNPAQTKKAGERLISLTNSLDESIQIVQRSLNKGWKNFYPLPKCKVADIQCDNKNPMKDNRDRTTLEDKTTLKDKPTLEDTNYIYDTSRFYQTNPSHFDKTTNRFHEFMHHNFNYDEIEKAFEIKFIIQVRKYLNNNRLIMETVEEV